MKYLGGLRLAGDVKGSPLAARAFGKSLFCGEAGDFRMIIRLAQVGKHQNLGTPFEILH